MQKLKTDRKDQHIFHTIALSKGTNFAKNADFCPKTADISKIKGVSVLKEILFETKYVCTNVKKFKFLA